MALTRVPLPLLMVDTEAELPASIGEGMYVFCKDTGNAFHFTGGTYVAHATGAPGEPLTVGWADIQDKPLTFPPPAPVFTPLANDTLAMALATNNAVQLTVTVNRTLTTTVPAAGHVRHIKILAIIP